MNTLCAIVVVSIAMNGIPGEIDSTTRADIALVANPPSRPSGQAALNRLAAQVPSNPLICLELAKILDKAEVVSLRFTFRFDLDACRKYVPQIIESLRDTHHSPNYFYTLLEADQMRDHPSLVREALFVGDRSLLAWMIDELELKNVRQYDAWIVEAFLQVDWQAHVYAYEGSGEFWQLHYGEKFLGMWTPDTAEVINPALVEIRDGIREQVQAEGGSIDNLPPEVGRIWSAINSCIDSSRTSE